MSFPTLNSLKAILFDEDVCKTYLLEVGALDCASTCRFCGGNIALHQDSFRCTAKRCRKRTSMFAGSFFSRSILRCDQVLFIGYLWLSGANHTIICRQTGHSTRTITDYLGHYRQLVCGALEADDCMIGGEGVVVELDESKFGKRKCNRGHHVDGAWVIGGVERGEARRMFVQVVEDRSAETLLRVISEHVLPGSIVYTDLWKGYSGIEYILGLEHLTVNHSKTYKDPETGCHTNTIEGTWNGIKMRIPVRNRTFDDITDHLLEFVWRRKHQADLWSGLLEAFRMTSYS
jgi:transposase-like protein